MAEGSEAQLLLTIHDTTCHTTLCSMLTTTHLPQGLNSTAHTHLHLQEVVAEGSEAHNVESEALRLCGNISQEALTAAAIAAATAAASAAAAAWHLVQVLLPDCCQAARPVGHNQAQRSRSE
jgi:hypothetical protein